MRFEKNISDISCYAYVETCQNTVTHTLQIFEKSSLTNVFQTWFSYIKPVSKPVKVKG